MVYYELNIDHRVPSQLSSPVWVSGRGWEDIASGHGEVRGS